jgi:hypothetical protein
MPNIRILLAILTSIVLASTGDIQPDFRNCVKSCNEHCQDWIPPSIAMVFTAWTCDADCKYECMHHATDSAIVYNQKIHQYYGKWYVFNLL